MTKKTRTVLFLLFLLIFIIAAPSAVFYSQGYRVDFENKKITRTGAFYLKILPKSAEIYLDGELVKKTDVFFGSALIENLLPKKYRIEIKKDGYSSWGKILEIKEKMVTDLKNIILFPENPKFEIMAEGIKKFWFSPNQSKIILKEGTDRGWALKIYELKKNVKSHLIEEKDVSPKGADLLDLRFSGDSNEIYLEIGTAEQLKYFTLNLNKIPPELIENDPPPPSSGEIIAYQNFNNDDYYLNNLGYFFKNEGKLNKEPFPIKKETKYNLRIFPNFIFLEEEKILYRFNSDLKSFEKFFEPLNGLKLSPDFKKIVYFSEHEIWVLFLKEMVDQPQRKAGEQLFLIRLSEKIDEVFWLNSDYFLFSAEDKIKIAETDNRDRVNVTEVGEFENLEKEKTGIKMFWNEIDRELYVLSKETLYKSEKLLQ